MFTDNATIKVIAGNGGPGLSSFRRERYVDRGGPDGGDGGDGGDIVAAVKDSIHGLSDYRHIREIKAKHGEKGGPQNKHGKSAIDKIIYLPKGTLIYEDGKVIADLVDYNTTFIIAKGGQGGYGNAHFKSSTRQAPKVSERGEPGEQRYSQTLPGLTIARHLIEAHGGSLWAESAGLRYCWLTQPVVVLNAMAHHSP